MKKLLIAAVLSAFAMPAVAADMAVKGLRPIGPYPTTGCGAYYGIDALASASTVKNAPVGDTVIGGDIGGSFGYTCATSPSSFWFVEVIADFQNLNGSQNGLALTGPAHLEQRAGFGGPLNAMLPSLFPNLNLPAVPSLPVLPAGVTAGTANGYIYAAINEDDISAKFGNTANRQWIITPEAGLGMLTRLSNNVVADVWAGMKLESQAICLGNVTCPKIDKGFVTGVAFKY